MIFHVPNHLSGHDVVEVVSEQHREKRSTQIKGGTRLDSLPSETLNDKTHDYCNLQNIAPLAHAIPAIVATRPLNGGFTAAW